MTAKSKKQQPSGERSITGVNPQRGHGVGVWGSRRIVVGVRVDEKLYEAAKPFLQRVFGSVCLPVESIMAGLLNTWVEAEKAGVNPGKTVKIDVGKILIHRNLRSRRRLEQKPTVKVEVARQPVEECCGFCNKSEVVGVFEDRSGLRWKACRYHATDLRVHPKWKEVSSG